MRYKITKDFTAEIHMMHELKEDVCTIILKELY